MSRTGLERSSALSRVEPQRGRLRAAVKAFEAASQVPETPGEPTAVAPDTSAAAPSEEAWSVSVARALDELLAAWDEHVDFTESPEGLFAELLDDSLDVASEVDRLRRDHGAVAAAIARAGELLVAHGASPDDEQLLDWLGAVAKQVNQHRRRGAELLYRVYSVDLAGGD